MVNGEGKKAGNIQKEEEVEEEQGWDAVLELQMQGLVMPDGHAEPCSQRSAQGCKEQEGGFGYAAMRGTGLRMASGAIATGFPLIQPEEQEGKEVEGYEAY